MLNSLVPFTRLDQVFDDLFTPARPRNGDGPVTLMPRADVLEGEKDFQIRMELPGVKREDVEIQFENQVLTVSATRHAPTPEGYKVVRGERLREAAYRRSFRLGRDMDGDAITAAFEDGVLVLHLAKSEKALPRRIEVR